MGCRRLVERTPHAARCVKLNYNLKNKLTWIQTGVTVGKGNYVESTTDKGNSTDSSASLQLILPDRNPW